MAAWIIWGDEKSFFVFCLLWLPPALAHQPGLSDGWRRHELNLHISCCSKQSCTRTLDCLHSRYPGRVTAVGSSNVAPDVRCQTHGFQDSSKVLKVKHIRGITSPSPARYPLLTAPLSGRCSKLPRAGVILPQIIPQGMWGPEYVKIEIIWWRIFEF